MSDAKVHLDRLTNYYIMNYKPKEYKELIDKLDRHEMELKEIYGKGEEGKHLYKFKDYKKNKIKELYTRMDNKTLREIKEIYMDKENNSQRISNHNNTLSKNNDFSKKISITKRDINRISKALGDELDNIKNQNMYERMQIEIEIGR